MYGNHLLTLHDVSGPPLYAYRAAGGFHAFHGFHRRNPLRSLAFWWNVRWKPWKAPQTQRQAPAGTLHVVRGWVGGRDKRGREMSGHV